MLRSRRQGDVGAGQGGQEEGGAEAEGPAEDGGGLLVARLQGRWCAEVPCYSATTYLI